MFSSATRLADGMASAEAASGAGPGRAAAGLAASTLGAAALGASGLSAGSSSRRGAGLAFSDGAQHGADLHGFAFLDGNGFQRSGGGRRHFDRDLVGFQFAQGFVARDAFAFLLEPAGDGGLGHGFTHGGHFNFDAHIILPRDGRARPFLTGSKLRSRIWRVRRGAGSSGPRQWRPNPAVQHSADAPCRPDG